MTVKICATCIHLKVLDRGREFEFIIDTEYTLFECDRLKQRIKEFYLMAPVSEHLDLDSAESTCPYWESWKENG